MKKIITLFILLQCTLFSSFGQVRIEPSIKSKTTFAIIVDAATYQHAQKEIKAYQQVIEHDNLGTYIIADTWKQPQDIKAILMELYQSKSPLEGAVFIGDIPIPMVRDAQHMTSAFKMDQTLNWKRSSVPSDRYYDDFDLQFDFIKQDEDSSNYFYFSLKPNSPQRLSSDIYTARIRPYTTGQVDSKELIKLYLQKVVKERTENANNLLDKLSVARGYGYNSESKVAWSGEQLALAEQLPTLFGTSATIKFMDFESKWPMKPYILNELCQPELDVMLLHHHGSPTAQYINGYKRGSDLDTSIENIKLFLRSKLKGNKRADERGLDYVKRYGFPQEWIDEAIDFDNKFGKEDSLLNVSLEIQVDDLKKITPNARFVMFDACYNGSFHKDDYIAANYIFNSGKTIVTQGNTVNALQDKWPDEMIGLLAQGVRVGNWHKMVNYLETHLIGDPTYRFYAPDIKDDLNLAIQLKKQDNKYWKRLLKDHRADVQALALRMLKDNNDSNINHLLLETYLTSQFAVVRMEALHLLGRSYSPELVELLKVAPKDSYELIRRIAIPYIANVGSDELIPTFVNAMINDATSERISLKIQMNLSNLNLEKIEQELSAQSEQYPLYDDSFIKAYYTAIKRAIKSDKENIDLITDKAGEAKSRRFQVRAYRNNPATKHVDALLKVVFDNSDSDDVRLAVAEALAWYGRSYKKDYIIQQLQANYDTLNCDVLKTEVTRTVSRLQR